MTAPLDAVVAAVFAETVEATVDGQARTMTRAEELVRAVLHQALHGDTSRKREKAIDQAIRLQEAVTALGDAKKDRTIQLVVKDGGAVQAMIDKAMAAVTTTTTGGGSGT